MQRFILKLEGKASTILKTDIRYLARGGFWLVLSQIVAVGAGILVSIGFANLIPKESFGEYKYILSLASILSAFTLTGMETSITRSVAQGYEGALVQGVRSFFKGSVIMIVIALIGSSYYFLHHNTTLALGLLLIALGAPLVSGFGLFSAFIEGKKDFQTRSIFSFAQNVFPPAVLLGTLLLTDSVQWILIAYFGSTSFVTTLLYFYTLHWYKPTHETTKETLDFGFHVSAINFLGTIGGQVDRVLVFQTLGSAPLAIYSFAVAPISQMQNLNKIIGTLLFPRLSTHSIESIKKSAMRKIVALLLLALVLFVTYVSLAPYIFKMVFPKYLDAVWYSQVYALVLFFFPLNFIANTLVAHAKKRQLYIRQIVTPIVKISAAIILLPMYGILGAILAILLSKLVDIIITSFFFYHLEE